MPEVTLPDPLFVAFDDESRRIGYETPTPFVNFALQKRLDKKISWDSKSFDFESFSDLSYVVSTTVEISEDLYEAYNRLTAEEKFDDTESVICCSLYDYYEQSQTIVAKELSNELEMKQQGDEIKENLKDLGYIQ